MSKKGIRLNKKDVEVAREAVDLAYELQGKVDKKFAKKLDKLTKKLEG